MKADDVIEGRTYRYTYRDRLGRVHKGNGEAYERVPKKGPHTSAGRWVLKDTRTGKALTLHANALSPLPNRAPAKKTAAKRAG